MVRERIGNTFLHGCGEIFQSRTEKLRRCPRCDAYLHKGDLIKITKKQGKEIYKTVKGAI